MALPTVTGEARIIGQPEIRHTPAGAQVMQFRAVANRRKYNEQTREWENTGECWLNFALWEKLAERNDGYLNDKDLIVYEGDLETRSFERKDGTKGLSVDVRVSQIGKVAPAQNAGGGAPSGGFGQSQGFQPAAQGGWGSQDTGAPF